MAELKNIFVIIGSASKNSANEKLVDLFVKETKDVFQVKVLNDLKTFAHFDPELSVNNPPEQVVKFRNAIQKADGILISTPEYVFSIPSGLKNVIEWCVSTTVFSGKATALITASASGQKGHEELQLIMKTVMARFTNETTLLIPGIKGKLNEEGVITDVKTLADFEKCVEAFKLLVQNTV